MRKQAKFGGGARHGEGGNFHIEMRQKNQINEGVAMASSKRQIIAAEEQRRSAED